MALSFLFDGQTQVWSGNKCRGQKNDTVNQTTLFSICGSLACRWFTLDHKQLRSNQP